MHRGQVLIAVALVILAELAGGVTEALHHRGDGHIGLLPAFLGAWEPHFGHARTNRDVAAKERRTAGRAALLAVIVGEREALVRNPVDVRRLISHHPSVVVAYVPGADVVTPNNEDIGFF